MKTNPFFPEIHGNFGFGCMRFPMADGKIDVPQVQEMVDAFLRAGFNYFDTAHGYHGGESEKILRQCLTSRYDRSQYLLTDKLTDPYFQSEADVRPFILSQLDICGVDYFDFYLMHAQDGRNFQKFKRCRAYETAFAMKAEGKLRHVGISFHDKAEVLDEILTTYPQLDVVQLQFNYVDYDSPAVESKKCYDVCVKHGKPVLVMEPVKGGHLVELPAEAQAVFDALHGGSNASYAVRFAASFPNVCVVLSGMSSMAQMEDNIATMADFRPLDDAERLAIDRVRGVFQAQRLIPCTGCRYCVYENTCPQGIQIPDLFSCYNLKSTFHDWNQDFYYHQILTAQGGKASDCIGCGGCEAVCPQHLEIRTLLQDVSASFDK